MARGISLANKCQLLFGAAVVLIIAAALIVPWIRLETIVDQSQHETSRQIARLWVSVGWIEQYEGWYTEPTDPAPDAPRQEFVIGYWPADTWEAVRFKSPFMQAMQAHFREQPGAGEAGPREYTEALWDGEDRVYRLARMVLTDDGRPRGVIVVERRSGTAAGQLLVHRLYLVTAGLGAGVLAVLVFYVITTRIILGPVRALRDTAELVSEGNLHIRSEIRTGDEFEQLSDAFNRMLADLGEQQQQLRGINRSLDMRLTELAERNVALYEAARLKGEFLARISHELRTPLNSIIGFAELLQDIAASEAEEAPTDGERMAKRRRYLDNIVNSGRTLLEMINELLMMAKIEAGKTEVQTQDVNVAELCESLAALIRPLADRKRIRVVLQLQAAEPGRFVGDAPAAALPVLRTDPQKLQQIVFNFLSNAAKFTPEEGEVVLRAERALGNDGEPRVRISVLDTGPGIPPEQHRLLFQKFTQLDGGHTRQHQGTGLGLAIAKEFADMLGAEIQLVSEVGRGSMFSLIVPVSGPALRRSSSRGQPPPSDLPAEVEAL